MSKRRFAWLTPETLPASDVCRVLFIPDSDDWRGIVNGALANLTFAENFEQFGALTPEEVADRFALMFTDYVESECVAPVVSDRIIIEERQALGTSGGTFTAGAWRTRALNTEVLDTANIASLSANRVSLPAGTYRVSAAATAFGVLYHRTRLYNVTTSAAILYGVNALASTWARSFDAFGVNTSNALLFGEFTLASAASLELQHYAQSTTATYGFGVAGGTNHETYASLSLERIA